MYIYMYLGCLARHPQALGNFANYQLMISSPCMAPCAAYESDCNCCDITILRPPVWGIVLTPASGY